MVCSSGAIPWVELKKKINLYTKRAKFYFVTVQIDNWKLIIVWYLFGLSESMLLLSLVSHQHRTQLYPSHTQDWQAGGKVSWFMCMMENLLCSSQNLVDITIYSVYIIYCVNIIYIIYCVDIIYLHYLLCRYLTGQTCCGRSPSSSSVQTAPCTSSSTRCWWLVMNPMTGSWSLLSCSSLRIRFLQRSHRRSHRHLHLPSREARIWILQS